MFPFFDLSFNSISNSDVSGPFLLIGILFFSIQIYCDFSGYTDIAIGVSRLFGIELLQNFNFSLFLKEFKRILEKMAYKSNFLFSRLFVHPPWEVQEMDTKKPFTTFFWFL